MFILEIAYLDTLFWSSVLRIWGKKIMPYEDLSAEVII